jgi:quercetin dioxygenase-like cupin family protein
MKNSNSYVSLSGEGKKLNILGHTAYLKLQRPTNKGLYYVMEVHTPPGVGIPPHMHDREEEMIYIIEGTFTIMLGDRHYELQAGDHIFFPKHIPHAFQNVGKNIGRTLWTIVPGSNFEDFFEDLNELSKIPELPMDKIISTFGQYGMQVMMQPPM